MFRKASLGVLSLSILLGLCKLANASGLVFDYKDPKEISAVSLTIDSLLEPIVGYARGISGTVNFDPANPKGTTGKIAVDVSSVLFANEGYTATARGFALNEKKYPQIFFTLRKVLSVTKPTANVYKAMVLADFTCRGITVPLKVPVTASYFPGRAEERTNGNYKGDLLILRTQFDVSRSRHGISEGIPADMVGDTVQVRVAVVGIHYTGKKPDAPRAVSSTGSPNRSEGKSERSATKTSRLWKMEVELRDDPLKVDAQFDLDAAHPSAVFATGQGKLSATDVKVEGTNLTFHIPDNPHIGAAEGEAHFQQETLQGTLRGKDGTYRFHARVKLATDDTLKETAPGVRQGPGFADLKIEADGKTWTLADRMKNQNVPAVSLARIEDFKVVETGAYGVTDVETGELVDTKTLFHAGGMGSPLVNLLVLRLAAQGKLELNAEVNTLLKNAKIPENSYTQKRKVTVLDLVNGTSGLMQYKFAGYRPGVKVPTLNELLNGADSNEMEPLTVTAEPGSKFQGAGINGAILEQVITDVTGRPLPDLMRELIFDPIGMTLSTYEPFPTSNSTRKVAIGHYSTGERMLDSVHIYPETGETGLWTTAGEFAKMLCQVQLMLAEKPNVLLTEAQRPVLKQVITEQWTLGLVASKGGNFLPVGFAYHGGDPYGYFANHATHLSRGIGMIVMENRIMGWRLNNEIIKAVAIRNGWKKNQEVGQK